MELPEEKIFYTNWNPRTAGLFIDDWLVSKRTLPKAFVCANDELAILMCEHLRKFGIKVPDEVIVTGFDNLVFAQAYDPSISSVSQKFDKIGYESVRMLIDILEGKECEKERMVLCEFIPGESCGCWDCCKANEVRREVGRKRFIDNMNSAAFYRKLSTIDRCIMLSDHYDEIKTNFRKSNDKTFMNYEGGSYHVVLDPAFKEKMYDSSKKYRTHGYAEKMDVMFSLDNGVYYAGSDFEVRNIVPTIANKDSNHLFICLPLQDRGSCLGYVIFADDYEKFRNSIFMSKYMERLAAVLIKVQQTVNARILNEKLIEISETDALTHVKNRMAYQTREDILNKEIKKGLCNEFAILLCDINDLKAMNDAWGHERGDEYIKNSCKLVCDTFKKSAVYRLGGDEFAVILGGNDYQNATQLIHSMNEAMDGFMKQDIPVWEQVSVAAGIAYFDANKDTCVADVLKRADEKMYSRKREMKSTKH